MKKLTLSILLGLSVISLTARAEKKYTPKFEKSEISQNPWDVFKETLKTFKTSNVDFFFAEPTEKEAFFVAAERIQENLSQKNDEKSIQKIKKIDLAVTIFSYLWDLNNEMQSEEYMEIEIVYPEVM